MTNKTSRAAAPRRSPLLRFVSALFAYASLTLTAAASALIAYAEDIPDHWNPWRPLDLAAPWTPVQELKTSWAMDDPALCLDALARVGGARPMPELSESPTCGIATRVELSALGRARLEPMETNCRLALTLYLWERETLQPAAREIYGVEAARIHHFGSYSCRTIAGSQRMSRHARADAVDIVGVTLADGRRITVEEGWRGDDDEQRFLRRLRAGGCDRFDVVLSPDYNRAHRDHFHMDVGGWSACR